MLALMTMDQSLEGAHEPLRESLQPLAEPRHQGAKLLLNIWREREGHGGFTIGRDIPSRRVARIMHNVMVLEPVEKGGELVDFRVRLAGDTLRFRFGSTPGGKRLSQLFSPKEFADHLATTREALCHNMPIVLNSEILRGLVIERRLEVVLLPVWNADRNARWILVGAFYFD